ncbi:transcriptional regulator [Streptomyces sp. PSKA30]|uniref:transcriptional regulator n=1 Tax=Streptomyces sp. PSKA30 TaxID=2874597 RepID=UPI001CD08F7C|nr:transcriptional regulator [Streptomyces sp. PSKA30]MBZ9645155.1 helix-turn-helix domain-containing protein [Streptomyces sp. PSKA30]
MAGDEFSELLGRLKERSGLSYGVLGKRLHTSASTLHRYVNGDAVPTDYAPVERFARVCKATPEELVELHRRWVLADARRRQKAGGAPAEEEPRARTVTEAGAGAAEAGAETSGTEAATAEAGPEGGRRPLAQAPVARRRTAVLAGTAVAAVLVSAALAVNLVPGEGDDDRSGKQSAGAVSPSTGSVDSVDDSPGASESAGAKGRSASPSTSRSGTPTAPASASRSSGAGAAQGNGVEDGATAPNVGVNPYKWEDPCSQHYLVDRQPGQVPPPPSEPDARGWVTALGGVAGGQQMLALTVQGTGKATVVLEELHVRVVEKSAPLAWNDFEMGVGCGGGVETTSFGVDLDAGRPALSPKAGQRDFPYKVSESDPEVFYIFADARAHNVSWYLELDWSSGDQRGTVRVDDNGKPFRTSGNVGRPAYNYPLGSSEWGRNEYTPDIPG